MIKRSRKIRVSTKFEPVTYPCIPNVSVKGLEKQVMFMNEIMSECRAGKCKVKRMISARHLILDLGHFLLQCCTRKPERHIHPSKLVLKSTRKKHGNFPLHRKRLSLWFIKRDNIINVNFDFSGKISKRNAQTPTKVL